MLPMHAGGTRFLRPSSWESIYAVRLGEKRGEEDLIHSKRCKIIQTYYFFLFELIWRFENLLTSAVTVEGAMISSSVSIFWY